VLLLTDRAAVADVRAVPRRQPAVLLKRGVVVVVVVVANKYGCILIHISNQHTGRESKKTHSDQLYIGSMSAHITVVFSCEIG
jgi:hypothetical protein